MIKKLPDHIISRIAAGEVITAPYNIIKELIENSIDAKATRIRVTLSSTLLGLSVEDNGAGIERDDLDFVCKAHCTSKISELKHLKRCGGPESSATFGFRGEAMHSISHIAKVVLKTKSRADEAVGYRAEYKEGVLNNTRRIAMDKHGTVVEVSEIFHNNMLRKEQFYKNKAECQRCIDLLKSYAAWFPGIELAVDAKVVLLSSNEIRDISGLFTEQTVGSVAWSECSLNSCVYETEMKNKLRYLRSSFVYAGSESNIKYILRKKVDKEGLSLFSYCVVFSDKNLHFKKYKFILFINKRLVADEALKRKIGKAFRDVIGDSFYPFVYIELYLPFVDVNVHPSKAEVAMDEAEMYDEIIGEIRAGLERGHHNTSGGLRVPLNPVKPEMSDANLSQVPVIKDRDASEADASLNDISAVSRSFVDPVRSSPMKIYHDSTQQTIEDSFSPIKAAKATPAPFSSIKKLLSEIVDVDSYIYRDAIFVGCLDDFLYIQSQLSLIQIKRSIFLKEAFYCKILTGFGNFESVAVDPVPVALDSNTHGLLSEYFGLRIVNGCVTSAPSLYGLVATDWNNFSVIKTDEYNTFKECAKGIAEVYSRLDINHTVFNRIKREVVGTRVILQSSTHVTSLGELYKKFGRC